MFRRSAAPGHLLAQEVGRAVGCLGCATYALDKADSVAGHFDGFITMLASVHAYL